jgi:DNA-binding NarL/FixJ family response regulator
MFNTLLVEGNASFRQALSDVLFSYFPLINVEEAGDGEDALSKVEYRRPDIILMDIQLPGENGLQVTKEIKRVYKEIVIVILSTHALPEYRQQAFRHGADCFLSMEEDTYMDDILALVEAEMAGGS